MDIRPFIVFRFPNRLSGHLVQSGSFLASSLPLYDLCRTDSGNSSPCADLLFFYVVADAAGIQNRYVVGIAIMAIFSGAYISEILRAGIEGVGKSQLLSAKAIGFTEYQTFRYVIAPQALRSSLPALAGQTANLIKDSSLLSVIAISEFTLNAQEVNAITYSSFESFFPLAIGYLILTLPIMRLSRSIENRLRFET